MPTESPPKLLDEMSGLIFQMCNCISQHHAKDKEGNCVLVFLSGLSDIDEMLSLFTEKSHRNIIEVMILHSSIESEEQMKVFSTIDPGTTR